MHAVGRKWRVRAGENEDRPDRGVAAALAECLTSVVTAETCRIVLVCIGSDRSTGDSLGPLVGSYLVDDYLGSPLWGSSSNHDASICVVGTLLGPVHAGNLESIACTYQLAAPGTVCLAVDASLGSVADVQSVVVGLGPIQPGLAVNKSLPPIGDAHVTGTVNVGGFMEYAVLQSTRLSVVMRLASVIAAGIDAAIRGLWSSNLHSRSLQVISLPTARSSLLRRGGQ